MVNVPTRGLDEVTVAEGRWLCDRNCLVLEAEGPLVVRYNFANLFGAIEGPMGNLGACEVMFNSFRLRPQKMLQHDLYPQMDWTRPAEHLLCDLLCGLFKANGLPALGKHATTPLDT